MIPSETGPKQGCALGCLLFCLGLQPLLTRSAADSKVSCTAIIDDITISGQPKDLRVFSDIFSSLLSPTGLSINSSKSCILAHQHLSAHSSELHQLASSLQTRITQGSVQHLGVIIGSDSSAMSRWAVNYASSCTSLFPFILHERMPIQHALLILRQAAAPRLSYFIRCLTPDLTVTPCATFDQELWTTALNKLRIPTSLHSDRVFNQLSLPIKLGGFGLVSSARVAPAAYLSSVALAAPLLSSLSPVSRLLSPHSRLLHFVHSSAM